MNGADIRRISHRTEKRDGRTCMVLHMNHSHRSSSLAQRFPSPRDVCLGVSSVVIEVSLSGRWSMAPQLNEAHRLTWVVHQRCGCRDDSVGTSVRSCQVSELGGIVSEERHEHMESVRYCDVDSRGSCWFGSRENVELAIVTRTDLCSRLW